jgi:hypothetical protein
MFCVKPANWTSKSSQKVETYNCISAKNPPPDTSEVDFCNANFPLAIIWNTLSTQCPCDYLVVVDIEQMNKQSCTRTSTVSNLPDGRSKYLIKPLRTSLAKVAMTRPTDNLNVWFRRSNVCCVSYKFVYPF